MKKFTFLILLIFSLSCVQARNSRLEEPSIDIAPIQIPIDQMEIDQEELPKDEDGDEDEEATETNNQFLDELEQAQENSERNLDAYEDGYGDGFFEGYTEGRNDGINATLELLQNKILQERYEQNYRQIEQIRIQINIPARLEALLVPGREFLLGFIVEEKGFFSFEIKSDIDPAMELFSIYGGGQLEFSDDQSDTNLNPKFTTTLDSGFYLLAIAGKNYNQEGTIFIYINEVY